MITAELIYNELITMPISEREKLFSMIARSGFDKESYTHDDVFGDVKTHPFTLKEAAEYLEVSEITVRRWIKEGSFKPSRKHGRSWVFDAAYLSDFKKSR